jgi:hypothetical protein
MGINSMDGCAKANYYYSRYLWTYTTSVNVKDTFCPKKFPLSSTENEGHAIWIQIIENDKLHLIGCIVPAATVCTYIHTS